MPENLRGDFFDSHCRSWKLKIRPPVFAAIDDKKKGRKGREGKRREGKGRERKGVVSYRVTKGLYFGHFGPISTKIGRVKRSLDLIILSNFGFNIFRGFRSTGSQNPHLPVDFAGHRYKSTAQPVYVMCDWLINWLNSTCWWCRLQNQSEYMTSSQCAASVSHWSPLFSYSYSCFVAASADVGTFRTSRVSIVIFIHHRSGRKNNNNK